MHASRSSSSLVLRRFVAGPLVFGLSLIAGAATSAQVAAADPAPTGTAKPTAPKPSATAKPEAAKADPAEPDTAKPAAAKPDVAKPDVVKPDVVKPDVVKPDVVKPDVVKPDVVKPDVVKPDVVKPDAVKADAPKPPVAKPATEKPVVEKPATPKPATAKPDAAKPAAEKAVAKKPSKPSVSLPSPVEPSDANPFDGKSLAGWTTSSGKAVPSGWEIVDGAIHLKKGAKGGNIVTAQEYGSFTLEFEWKIAKGGNSGIKYRVRDYDGKILGIEYQIYDDPKNGPAKGSAGSIYDLYAPNAKKTLKPVGEFNTGKISVRGNQIEHWLNGELVAGAVIGSADWHKHVAESKFNDVNGFALHPQGRLMLTDHGTEVWYRNMKFETFADAGPANRATNRSRHRVLRSLFGR